MTPLEKWIAVQNNGTYLPGALSDEEGLRIKWHSPTDVQSSQVFCISVFGTLRSVPDGFKILNQLLAAKINGMPVDTVARVHAGNSEDCQDEQRGRPIEQ